MFSRASAFNQNIDNWNVSNVTDMSSMFYTALSFNQNIGGWNFSSIQNIDGILNNSGLTAETYDNTLNSLASSTTLPSGLDFGGSGLVYSPAGKTAHDTLSVKKGLVFDGDAFISTDVIRKDIPFNFVVNAGTSFSTGEYTFPTGTVSGYPAEQTYTLENVPGKIPYEKLIFTISGDRLPVLLESTDTEITYYLTVKA